MKQMGFKEFGGNTKRFSSKKPVHVVLRSRHCTLRNRRNINIISSILYEYSKRFNVRIYQNSLNSNHIHLVLLAKDKKNYQNFVRVVAGQIAQRISGGVRGRALAISFWLKVAWSRVVEWGRDFRGVITYILMNQRETLGWTEYSPRKRNKVGVRPAEATPTRQPGTDGRRRQGIPDPEDCVSNLAKVTQI